jgi:hypothetical protein
MVANRGGSGKNPPILFCEDWFFTFIRNKFSILVQQTQTSPTEQAAHQAIIMDNTKPEVRGKPCSRSSAVVQPTLNLFILFYF